MKVVILCGGFGTRIRDVADNIPKPMIPIGSFPILWHIMKSYASWGHKEFVLCLGYKAEVIKQFFLNYDSYVSDLTITYGQETAIEYHNDHDISGWKVTLAETGLDSLTARRVQRIRQYVGDEDFMLTYGDGLSDINLDRLVEFHRNHGKVLTVSGVRPPARFGEIESESDGRIVEFNEKPQATGGRISGGFFVCKPAIFDYLSTTDNQMLELEPMKKLVRDGEMMLYNHDGFWQCMDTQRDHRLLSDLWEKGPAPWRRW